MPNSEDIILKTVWDDSESIQGLNKMIAMMDKAGSSFEEMQKDANDSAKAIGKDLVDANQKVSKEIDNVVKATSRAAKAEQDRTKAINDVAKAITSSTLGAEKFGGLWEKLEKLRLSGAITDVADLEKEFEALFSSVQLTSDQINILESDIEGVAIAIADIGLGNGLQQVSNEIKDLSNIDVKQLEDRLEQLALQGQKDSDEFKELAATIGEFKSRLTEADRAVEFYAKSTDALSTALGEMEDRMYDLALAGKQNSDEYKELRDRVIQMKDAIKTVDAEVDRFVDKKTGFATFAENVQLLGAGFQAVEGAQALLGDSSEDLQKAFVRLNAIMAVTNAIEQARGVLIEQNRSKTGLASIAQKAYSFVVGESTGVLKGFRIALASTGIGLLVIGLGALIANFDKAKKVVLDFIPGLGKVGSAVKGLYAGMVETFKGIGDVVSTFWNDGISAAIDKAKELGKRVSEAGRNAFDANEAQKVKDAIAKDLESLAKSQKKRAEILEAGGKDASKVIETATSNELAALKLRGEETAKIEDKQHELMLLQIERQKKDEDERKKIYDEYLKRFKAVLKEVEDVTDDFDNLSAEEKFNVIKQKTLEQFSKLREELVKTANALGKNITPELIKFDSTIKQLEQREFAPTIDLPKLEKQIKKGQKVVTDNPINIPAPKFAEGAEAEFTSELEKFAEDFGGSFQEILDQTLTAIFDDPELVGKISDFLQAGYELVNQFGDILNEATQIKIDNIDKQLDRLSERREKTEDELEKELELQKEGLANNVGAKQDEVDGLLAEETRLQKERDELQREATRRQLIAETAQQTAGLISTSVNIIRGATALFGPLGLGIGIAAVASLFGFFAATKAKAFQATKLYTGAKSIDDHFGQIAPNGRTDIPGRGEGYRVIDAVTGQDTNVRISGREMLLPEHTTDANKEFFNHLLSGKYDNLDLAGIMALHQSNKNAVNSGNVTAVVNNTVVNVPKRQYITYTPTKGKNKGKTVARLVDIPEKDNMIIILED